MMTSKVLASMAVLATLLCAQSASAAGTCVFYAADSVYYNTSSESEDVHAYGPISFTWEPATNSVLSGSYTEQVVDPPVTQYSDITSGVILGPMVPVLNLSIPSMSFDMAVVPAYSFFLVDGTITGLSSAAILRGYLDGPNLIEAVGTVVCD
jgi:hypothetical protein